MRWSWVLLVAGSAALTAGLVVVPWCHRSAATRASAEAGAETGLAAATPVRESVPGAAGRPAPITFADVTDQTGIDFVAFSGTTPEKKFPTANGTGVAMLDYDQDGRMDFYFANGKLLMEGAREYPNGLWRNAAEARFRDVSVPSGTDLTGYTQGLAAGDYNNDGFPDLYLIRFGPNVMLENNGDGTFRDVTKRLGVGDGRWGTSAAFVDYDGDGSPDLYVANYGKWDEQWHRNHICGERMSGEGSPLVRLYCSPKILPPEVDCLYQAQEDGTFRDRAAELGIARDDGRGQGVVAADLNNDGRVDIFVANDLTPNFLFLGAADGRLEDHTEDSFAAYNARGETEACMGVDAGDTDGDGLPELFVTNFFLESNTLYKNLGNGLFQDDSDWSGVAADSIRFVGWGTALEDLDNDGWLDIFVVNGHVDDNMHELGRDEPYRQQSLLWRNVGGGRFEPLQQGTGRYFRTAHVSRGAAFGDWDNDGDVDVVISHKDERPTVLRNDSSVSGTAAGAWLRLKLVGTRSNRDAVGTRVDVTAGGRTLYRQIRGGKSYVSGHDLRLTIGLGQVDHVESVTVHWPSGQRTVMQALAVNRSYTVREPVD